MVEVGLHVGRVRTAVGPHKVLLSVLQLESTMTIGSWKGCASYEMNLGKLGNLRRGPGRDCSRSTGATELAGQQRTMVIFSLKLMTDYNTVRESVNLATIKYRYQPYWDQSI